MERLEEARRVLKLAFEELERYRRDCEPLRLRNACEKGWLALVLATDVLLVNFGYRRPESYSERRRMLKDLEAGNPEIAKVGLRDRFGARGYYLHIQGYHEGTLNYVEVEEELRRVEEYIRDVEKILKTLATAAIKAPHHKHAGKIHP